MLPNFATAAPSSPCYGAGRPDGKRDHFKVRHGNGLDRFYRLCLRRNSWRDSAVEMLELS
jgi:hypothetical protein